VPAFPYHSRKHGFKNEEGVRGGEEPPIALPSCSQVYPAFKNGEDGKANVFFFKTAKGCENVKSTNLKVFE